MAKERKKHTEEFKRDAVRMMRNRGQRTVAQVADDLGVNANQLHRWASLFEQTATAKRNVQGETLEKENERLRMEKTILKKAAAFFAKEDE
jgi:transposase